MKKNFVNANVNEVVNHPKQYAQHKTDNLFIHSMQDSLDEISRDTANFCNASLLLSHNNSTYHTLLVLKRMQDIPDVFSP